MLTKKDRELVDYYKNWKPGTKQFKPSKIIEKKEPEVIVVENNKLDYLAEDICDRLWDII